MSKQDQHLVLIDGYGFLFRAFFACPPLKRMDGTNVGAVFGFTSMLIKVILEFCCSHLAVVFDVGGKNFRHQIFPEYKSHRPPAPEDLIPQFPLIREAVASLNIDILEKQGFEADDIIATYAKMASNQGIRVTIISSDKDLMQLIDDNISLYDPLKAKAIKAEQVMEKFGVRPDQVQDVLSLIGDSSDFVPGVAGIGPKGAAELISQFENLENLYQNIEQLKPSKRKDSLIENKDLAFLSHKLVELCDHVEMPYSLDDLRIKIAHVEQFKEFLQKQSFNSLYQRAEKICHDFHKKNGHHHDPLRSTKIKELKEKDELKNWLDKKAHSSGVLSIILEADLLIISADISEVIIINCQRNTGLFQNNHHFSELKQILLPFLENNSITKIVHDAKRLYHLFGKAWVAEDLQLMSYLLNNGIHNHDFKTLIQTYASFEQGMEFNPWLCHSCTFMLQLATKFKQRLIEEKLFVLYERIEKHLPQILYQMEMVGIKLDRDRLTEISQDFAARSKILEEEIYRQAGSSFNLASPKQLAEVLFNQMGLKAKNNKNSTNAEVLEELALEGHEIADLILKWRHLTKLNNTYATSLGALCDENSRIHSNFQITNTSTGRLSSINPNLQNIPTKTEDGIKIRSAFIAEKGYTLLSADYSQIELRLLSSMANVETLKQAFIEGKDIHAITASEVFNVELSEVSKELRQKAKAINFGIIYGQGAFGLAANLGISKKIAAEYIENYFKHYPGIKDYMEKTKDFARNNGFVETLFGRRCYIKTINDTNVQIRNFAERAAINAPIQGTGADIIKKAMIVLDAELRKLKLPANILIQIHDELLLEVREDKLEEVSKLTKKIMESVISLSVPLIVDVSSGKNWAEL